MGDTAGRLNSMLCAIGFGSLQMNCRTYGQSPFISVAVHGGPGAPGSASSLAKGLSAFGGSLEPLQSAASVNEQVEELASQIHSYTKEPITIFGHSWGAWLTYLLAYSHPELVRKAILVASGAFDALYVPQMDQRRLSRLSNEDAAEYRKIVSALQGRTERVSDALLSRLGQLAGKADDYCLDPIPDNEDEPVRIDGVQFESIWSEASSLRESGYFMKIAQSITIPVRVIHGAEDPTPVEGVVTPLRANLKNLKWYVLEKCGHQPWKERYARAQFWEIVKAELLEEGLRITSR